MGDLLSTGGLSADEGASYGEDRNCQGRPGASGDAGRDHRRMPLLVDCAGPASAPAAGYAQQPPEQPQTGDTGSGAIRIPATAPVGRGTDASAQAVVPRHPPCGGAAFCRCVDAGRY